MEDFCDYFKENGFDDEVVESFRRNAISRTTFLLLEGDLKELVPMMGSRAKVWELLRTLKSDNPEVSHRVSHVALLYSPKIDHDRQPLCVLCCIL